MTTEFDAELERHGLRIKTHGLRWRIALGRALSHSARTGHGDQWMIGPDPNLGGFPVISCPDCQCRARLSVERQSEC